MLKGVNLFNFFSRDLISQLTASSYFSSVSSDCAKITEDDGVDAKGMQSLSHARNDCWFIDCFISLFCSFRILEYEIEEKKNRNRVFPHARSTFYSRNHSVVM